ncbi:uncharacterized protein LOC117578423 [Drosophila guanche]|uniref:Ig-like domain-containing protein n=2 Tax=Drosophila guanche TaxID=7266 RepID=A0A3B0IYK4_DROGU|nr:uncharacterized protein LOC117578423 [Drosophila guanche]SPP73164.1 Hypothetical predicted protein [Drosophila guanche]
MDPLLIVILTIGLFQRGGLCLPAKDDSQTKLIVLQNEDMEPTVLDCAYDIKDTQSFLTVKWFRDDKTIYQWIRGAHPAPIPEFKNDIDSSYESSTDPNKQYSSLALINPTIHTTGDYKCVVQTGSETITKHQKVQVIDVRNYTLYLNQNKIQNETQLECVVSNVFPKPTLTIISEDDDVVKKEPRAPEENEDGYFNATTVVAVYDSDDDVDSYQCVVSFEGYSKNLTAFATSGGSAGGHIDFRMWLFCVMYFFLSKLKVLI